MDFAQPRVMAILNVTPDSFACRCTSITESVVLRDASLALQAGADILDIGGCSTRPGAEMVPEAEEWRRVSLALSAIRREWPEAVLSVDTFRSSVARRAIEEYGANLINDISGGTLDDQMFDVVAGTRTPYILTHTRATPATMSEHTQYGDVVSEVLDFLQQRLDRLHRMGVADVLIDPGFGFAKTTDQCYELLKHMKCLEVLGQPIVAGVSRKSMITRVLGVEPKDALNGTTALHMLALEQGASVLRVHDVKEAKEAITIYTKYYGS